MALEYHRAAGIKLPNSTVHAIIHAVIENQIAMAHPPVVQAMDRLAKGGLSRHECVHAIGSVFARELFGALRQESGDAAQSLTKGYDLAVEELTVTSWRKHLDQENDG